MPKIPKVYWEDVLLAPSAAAMNDESYNSLHQSGRILNNSYPTLESNKLGVENDESKNLVNVSNYSNASTVKSEEIYSASYDEKLPDRINLALEINKKGDSPIDNVIARSCSHDSKTATGRTNTVNEHIGRKGFSMKRIIGGRIEEKENPITSWKTAERKSKDMFGPKPAAVSKIPDLKDTKDINNHVAMKHKELINNEVIKEYMIKKALKRKEEKRNEVSLQKSHNKIKETKLKELDQYYRITGSKLFQEKDSQSIPTLHKKSSPTSKCESETKSSKRTSSSILKQLMNGTGAMNPEPDHDAKPLDESLYLSEKKKSDHSKKKDKSRYRGEKFTKLLKETLEKCDNEVISSAESSTSISFCQDAASDVSIDFKNLTRNERIAQLNQMAAKLAKTCQVEEQNLNQRLHQLQMRNVSTEDRFKHSVNDSLSLDELVSKLTALLPAKKPPSKENEPPPLLTTKNISKYFPNKSPLVRKLKSDYIKPLSSLGPDQLSVPPLTVISLENSSNIAGDFHRHNVFSLRNYSCREIVAATVIQAYFRGYKVRKITSKWPRRKIVKQFHEHHLIQSKIYFLEKRFPSQGKRTLYPSKLIDLPPEMPVGQLPLSMAKPAYLNLPQSVRPFAELTDTGDINAFVNSYRMQSPLHSSSDSTTVSDLKESELSDYNLSEFPISDLNQSLLKDKETQTSIISNRIPIFMSTSQDEKQKPSISLVSDNSDEIDLRKLTSSQKDQTISNESYIDLKIYRKDRKGTKIPASSNNDSNGGSQISQHSSSVTESGDLKESLLTDSSSYKGRNFIHLGSRISAELMYQDTLGDALDHLKDLENLRHIAHAEAESGEIQASVNQHNQFLQMQIDIERRNQKLLSDKECHWQQKERNLLEQVSRLEMESKIKSKEADDRCNQSLIMPNEALISAATAAVVCASMSALKISNASKQKSSNFANYSSDFTEASYKSTDAVSTTISSQTRHHSKSNSKSQIGTITLSNAIDKEDILTNDMLTPEEEITSPSVCSSSSEVSSVIKTDLGSKLYASTSLNSEKSCSMNSNIETINSFQSHSTKSSIDTINCHAIDSTPSRFHPFNIENNTSILSDIESNSIVSDSQSISIDENSSIAVDFQAITESFKSESHESDINTISPPLISKSVIDPSDSSIRTIASSIIKSSSFASEIRTIDPSTSKSYSLSPEMGTNGPQSIKMNLIPSDVTAIDSQVHCERISPIDTFGDSLESYSESFEPDSVTSDASESDIERSRNSKISESMKRSKYSDAPLEISSLDLKENFRKEETTTPKGALHSTMTLMKQLQNDEEVRFNQQKTLLKMQEQALIDEAKVKLASIQLEGGSNHRKKQRAVLLQLREQQAHIRHLIETQSLAAQQRKQIFSQHLQLLSSTSTNSSFKLSCSSRGQSPSSMRMLDTSLSSSDGLENLVGTRSLAVSGIKDTPEINRIDVAKDKQTTSRAKCHDSNHETTLMETLINSENVNQCHTEDSSENIYETNFDDNFTSEENSLHKKEEDLSLSDVANSESEIVSARKVSESTSCPKELKKIPFNFKFPLSPRSQLKHRRQSSESDDSFTLSQNETASDFSDGESKLAVLKEELALRKVEAENLQKEKRKMKKERIASQKLALRKQIGAYDAYIKQAKLDIEKETRELQTVATVKPLIKKPKVLDRSNKKNDSLDSLILTEVDKTQDHSSESSFKDDTISLLNESRGEFLSDKSTSFDNIELEISTSDSIDDQSSSCINKDESASVSVDQDESASVSVDQEDIEKSKYSHTPPASPQSEISEDCSTETILQSPKKSISSELQLLRSDKLDIYIPVLETPEIDQEEITKRDKIVSHMETKNQEEITKSTYIIRIEEKADFYSQSILSSLVDNSVDYMISLFNNREKEIGEIMGQIQEIGEVELKSGNNQMRKSTFPQLPTIDEAKPLETTTDVLANISPGSLSLGSPSKCLKESPRQTVSIDVDTSSDSLIIQLDHNELTSRLLSVQASSGDIGPDVSTEEFSVSSSEGSWLESEWWKMGSALKEEEDKINAEIARLEELSQFKEKHPDLVLREVPNKPPPPYMPPKPLDDAISSPAPTSVGLTDRIFSSESEVEKPVISPINPPSVVTKIMSSEIRPSAERPQPQTASNTISVMHRLSRADVRKLASEIFNVIPTREEKVLPMLQSTINLLYDQWMLGEDPILIENPHKDTNETEEKESEMSSQAFKHLLFDVTRHLVHEMFVLFKTPLPPVWRKGVFPHPAKPWQVAKNPTRDTLIEFVREKVSILMGWQAPTLRESVMVKWARKRRDMVDQILVNELQTEEASWTQYEAEEIKVKNSLSFEIMDDLISETAILYEKIIKKRIETI